MASAGNQDWDEEFSVIGEKGEIGFIDYEDDKSVCSYNPIEEGPVIISVPFPFVRGKPQSIFIGERSKCSITLENTTGESIELWATKIFCSNPADSFTLSLIEPPSENSTEEHIRSFLEGFSLEDRVLQPHSTLTLWLSCQPMDMGLHTSVVHFDVDDDRLERVVFLLAEDKVSQSLASNKPYLKGSRKKPFSVDEYVAGSRPSRGKNTKEYRNRLPRFDIPKDIQELLESKQVPEVINEGLTRTNYAAFFTTLLIMEELHLKDEMSQFDMESVTMRRKGAQYVALEVPGLAEKRPSLIHGDVIFAKLDSHRSNDNTSPYEGYIHRVEADEVLLRFSPEFHTYHHNGNLYNIRFTYNRVGMRRTYQAIQEASKLEANLLFPAQSTTMRFIKTTPTVPITCNINEEQMRSVEMILGCEGIPPYVVYGPPGTGKTMTLVEAMLQLYSTRKNTRILVCAASNSAADHILNKIIGNGAVEVKETEIFRLNAPSRAYEDVHQDHIRFCYFEDFVFQCPPLKALMRYKIVISTYLSTSLIHAEGVCRGHFSHIFLDEAGQASEPDTMVSLSHLCRKETVVVLAGDPMQLGPVVFSKDAESFGLGKSYLQRLFDCEFYNQEDENYVTKLVRNYRCHPAILHLPSELFYEGELLACKEDVDLSNNDLSFDFLPSKDFPILFFGIQGCDEREGNNPSWFNRFEASQVVKIIQKLAKNTDSNELDIGVITPYRQQVAKLSKAIEDKGIEGIKVGSVEQFQGQEREVIIVSTVRSTIKHNEFDKTYSLGFLSNWRRFNVAITRAKSLLVIVGNPHIISKDPYWDKLLRYCVDNNSYEGCSLPERNDYEEEEQELRSNNENIVATQPSNEWLWGQSCQSEQVQELPVPITDESAWGDGWTS